MANKDLMVKIGSYKVGGEVKNRYQKIGIMMENDNGPFLLLDPSVSIAGCHMLQRIEDPQKAGTSLMVGCFENKPRANDGPPAGGRATPPVDQVATPPAPDADGFDDDIPF